MTAGPRVALDARSLQDRPLGGVGRGLASLVPRLAAEAELVLLTDRRMTPLQIQTTVPVVGLRGPLTRRSFSWLQLAAPSFLTDFDGLFHCPLYGLPYRQPVPMVVTIHDLTFEDHPEWFAPTQRAVFRLQARHAARTARRILTDSEAVRTQVIERYGVSGERVVVAPFAVDPSFLAPRDEADVRTRVAALGIDRPYVLALGGAPRRRADVALQAWRSLPREQPLDLVLVGEVGNAEPGVHRVGAVDDGTWSALLSGAAAFCYPTRYEGFGLPALEAAACGAPVVCAPVGALPELLGDAAEWCPDPSVEAIADGLQRVLTQPARADELRRAARARLDALPDWDASAAIIVEVYREALDG